MTTTTHQTLTIYGGKGWVGSALAAEAEARGHVVELGDRLPPPDCPGPSRSVVLIATDVLIVAVPGVVLAVAIGDLIRTASASNARLAVVGGSGSLLAAPGGARLMDAPDFREEWKPEARAHVVALQALRAASSALDWFYLSPPALFGSWTGTPSTGAYREGDDAVVLTEGRSEISGPDYARAFLDEVESSAHSRRRFTVAR
jgi:putative NADH-flavin reductase